MSSPSKNRHQYSAVPSSSPSKTKTKSRGNSNATLDNNINNSKIPRLTVKDYLESGAWIIAGSIAIYHSEIISITLTSPLNPILSNSVFFYFGLLSICVFFGAFIFLQYFLTFKVQARMPAQQLQVYAPVAIPVAAFSGLSAVMCFGVAYWQIFGWMTIVYFFFILMGSMAFLSLF